MGAQGIRLAIFACFLALAGIAFFHSAVPMAWVLPIAIAMLGSIFAEIAFRRWASAEEKRRDIEDRTRNPP